MEQIEPDDLLLLDGIYKSKSPYPEGDTGEAVVTGFKRVICFTTTFNGQPIALERSEESFVKTYPRFVASAHGKRG